MAKYRVCKGLALMAERDTGLFKDMSAQGWHVCGLSCGFLYRFEQGAPHSFDYAVDFERNFSPEVQELFRAGGWHPVVMSPGWQILRAEAGTTPLFTDDESKAEVLSENRTRTGGHALVWAFLLAVCLAGQRYLDAQALEPAATVALIGALASAVGLVFTALPFIGYTVSLRKVRAGR